LVNFTGRKLPSLRVREGISGRNLREPVTAYGLLTRTSLKDRHLKGAPREDKVRSDLHNHLV